MIDKKDHNILSQALLKCKKAFLYAFLFSFCINILMLSSPIYTLQVYGRILASSSLETLILISLMIGMAYLCMGGLQMIRSFVFLSIGTWLDKELSPVLLGVTIRVAAIEKRLVGSQLLRDLASLRGFITGPSMGILFDLPWAPIFLIAIFLIHPVMGGLAVLSAIILLGLAYLNERQNKEKITTSNTDSMTLFKDVELLSRNAEVLEAMGMLSTVVKRWQSHHGDALNSQYVAQGAANIWANISKTFRMFIQILSMSLSAYFVLKGDMNPGGIFAISLLMGKALAPFDQAIATWKSIVSTRQTYKRLTQVIGNAPDRSSAMALPEPTGKLSVENLSFAFPGSKKAMLKNISFSLEAGDVLGIIGPSASGKSTLVKLLSGVWKGNQGVVRLDDADIYTWQREDIGQYIGYLPQDIELFKGTVRENIARLCDTAEPDTIIAAAKTANIHEMILHMAGGYDAEIGIGGSHLSAGQRQRIGLARAFYGNTKLIILDEPNAHLDIEGEKGLAGAIMHAKKNKITLIIVAHRPSILQQVDKLLILKDGQVQEFGDAREIMQKVTPPQGLNHG